MAPELQILAINGVALAVGYLGVFPSLRPLTLRRPALADLGVVGMALATSGALFWGSGIGFALGPLTLNWFWFALVTLLVMEAPLLWWFARVRGLRFGPDE